LENGRNGLAPSLRRSEPVAGVDELDGPETVHHHAAGHDE
jgi:hypothetical protein